MSRQHAGRMHRTRTKAQRAARDGAAPALGYKEMRRHEWAMRVLIQKHGGICQLCGEAVLASGHEHGPDSATIDHVIPLARGGQDVISNMQLAHRRCNNAKGSDV